ncbi:phytoene desaturase [Fulvivirga sp. RKSG066]|uniref:1-hydroxycarotenoid 3,4-desaturase CrtD n=1 Tax=Fulvivirga aurantia TaxID=2529383 RepID=UPI0012BD259B|nr:1-hydroxycarotenoid 3,4-desaturase CrtD [Fulvivirga aurantia]MTI22524.1 phytoene desaturase [Fulvivirga aurantia]
MTKTIVIGAGIAGLASALRLRQKGHDVTVLEANPHAGGKLHAIKIDQYRFDKGPSLFTMPHLVDELFQLFGVDPRAYFNYKQKDSVCNYFWEDGTTFTVPAEEARFIKDAADTFNTSKQKLQAYLDNSRTKYELIADIFLKKSLHKAATYFNKETLTSLLQMYKLNIGQSLHGVNRSYFKDERLVQLFNRYATYNGSSPYQTPGIMSMIPHLEMHYGTFFPKGGMHSISQSLYKLAVDQGVKFKFNTPATEIATDEKKVLGVKTEEELLSADVVVTNTDVFTTYKYLLKDAKKPVAALKQERSSSAIIFYWGIDRTFDQLDLHNIIFSADYEAEFEHIFNKQSLSNDPTVYINITSKENPSDAPNGCENWFVMINAPANTGQDWQALITKARKNVIDKVNRALKTNIEKHIQVEEIWDPIGIEKETGSHQGSLYGTSSNSKFAAFLRHPNFSSEFKNLYFCGGSVHPGGGIPLCLLSAKIATDQIP